MPLLSQFERVSVSGLMNYLKCDVDEYDSISISDSEETVTTGEPTVKVNLPMVTQEFRQKVEKQSKNFNKKTWDVDEGSSGNRIPFKTCRKLSVNLSYKPHCN